LDTTAAAFCWAGRTGHGAFAGTLDGLSAPSFAVSSDCHATGLTVRGCSSAFQRKPDDAAF